MDDDDPIARPRISNEIVRRLEKQILNGGYSPGDHLPSERELMKRFGVGRPAVREALFSLQKSGLITIASGERARVCEPSPSTIAAELSTAARYILSRPDGIKAFQQVREIFESSIARYAAKNASEEQIVELEKALAANHAAIGNRPQFEQTDLDFHHSIAKISDNPILEALYSALSSWLYEQRRISLQHPPAEAAAYDAHRLIFEAIKSRDGDAAEKAMQEHIATVGQYYWLFKNQEVLD